MDGGYLYAEFSRQLHHFGVGLDNSYTVMV